MPNVLVRDVEDEVLEQLKLRAKNNGRSLQSEVKIILTTIVTMTATAQNEQDKPQGNLQNKLSDLETARKIRESLKLKFHQTDSAELLREDRNR